MTASEHRKRAREALKGNWPWAVLTSFVAMLLGAVSGSDGKFEIDLSELESADLSAILPAAAQSLLTYVLGGTVLALGLVSIVVAVVRLVVGSAAAIGYRKYLLNLIDGQPAEFQQLFSQFLRLGQGILLKVLKWLILAAPLLILMVLAVLLASLGEGILYFVTGILAFAALGVMVYVDYGLRMTEFLMADSETCGAIDALKQSWQMMNGWRWSLFCLEISFIGWFILAAFTFGLGGLVLTPYVQTANASFYRMLRPKYIPEPPVYGEIHRANPVEDF